MASFDMEKPLYSLSVEEFIALLDEHLTNAGNSGVGKQPISRNLVYGLRGIQELFGCSHKTAQAYKDSFLRPAVRQNGRKIVVDRDLALELFAAHAEGGKN